MLRVGLTGGIACGKSRVLRRMLRAGFHCIDLDIVAHRALAQDGDAYTDALRAFGPKILAPDRSIDRKALAAIVFRDPAALERLNAIVHPRVRAAEDRWIAGLAKSPQTVAVTDAALLVESGVHLRFDRLVVVHCKPETQLDRLMARDGLDVDAARARIAAQMPMAEKRRFAHFEVETSGTLEDSDQAADSLAVDLVGLARSSGPAPEIPRRRALGSLFHGPRLGPRGLRPLALLGELVESRFPELGRIARLMEPPAPGPWYRAAKPGQAGPPPATLAAPLALWALSRGAPDPHLLVAAAFSVARLTHVEPSAIADACAQALAIQEILVEGRPRTGGDEAARERLAERWAGAPPSGSLPRGGAPPGPWDADLAGMLTGAVAGASEAEAGEHCVGLLRGLGI